jgi:hypothetical protein
MLLSTIKLYIVLDFLVFGPFLFFSHTKFEITLRILVQKKFCDEKNLHYFNLKKKVWERFFDKKVVSLFTAIFRDLVLIFSRNFTL